MIYYLVEDDFGVYGEYDKFCEATEACERLFSMFTNPKIFYAKKVKLFWEPAQEKNKKTTEKVRVKFDNGTDIIISEKLLDQFFKDSDVSVEKLPDDFNISEEEITRHNANFGSLVGALDAKFKHTYKDYTETDSFFSEQF